jgi:AcrR family transcriptional regulator
MRLEPDQRRAVIITAAVRIARSDGFTAISHSLVAKRCTVETSKATVKHYFPDRNSIWHAVIAECPEFAEQGRELGLTC